ncbi:glycosyltransferase family 2 protein [Paenibacillus taichungensis]|uniref:Glycosyltransferase family 2 protein n=1 Tax=Paenibacillus taichungensis TaxID=484184 RepID=A0A329QLA5_9BACL|nr:glycosyltransferase family 2 protein [Paenibacillus taichungensis]RAW12202.1 glycosyltransferase family 2 protein [Paenibacillus taichungensis]
MDERWINMLRSLIVAWHEGILIYLILAIVMFSVLFLAAVRMLIRQRDVDSLQYDEMLNEELAPPVSLLVPVYNSENMIVDRVERLLETQYALYEIIIINDGSQDGTMQQLMDTYDLLPIQSKVHYSGLEREIGQIRAVYRSMVHCHLLVIDKEYGGHMDSLNVGINMSQYPYVASIGQATVLERDALVKIMKPVMSALPGEEIVACSGRVDMANGKYPFTSIQGITSSERALSPLLIMQYIEYVRAFLISGIGLVRYNINILLFTSQAFGVFKKNRIMEIGGYNTDSHVGHIELVMRLHKHMKQMKEPGRIIYIPDPICSVNVPESWSQLLKQRAGWHRQLAGSLWEQRSMIGNPQYGWMGMVSIPYFILVELMGPVLEIATIIFLISGMWLQIVDVKLCLVLALLLVLYGSLLSACAVMFEIWSSRRAYTFREVTRLFLYACSETFWFRPMNNVFRIYGLLQVVGYGKKNSKHGKG